jgi:hypothetical protein
LFRPYPSHSQGYERVNSFERLSYEKSLRGALLVWGCFQKCFFRFRCPDTQRALQARPKGVHILLELVPGIGIIHVALVLQTCKIQAFMGIIEVVTKISKEARKGR